MEISELKAFVKVVQSGSFTRAADALETQKSYLSRVVTGLERKLGVRLLERSTRSMHLTEIGREVYERAVGIIGAVDDTERIAAQLNAQPRGTLKLTCGTEFGMIAVSSWIDRYLQDYPQVSVEADFTGRLLDLVHEGFDLAIRIGELADSRLAARRLGELSYGLFASPAYFKRQPKPRHPADLRNHKQLVFHAGGHGSGWRLTRGAEQVKVEVSARLRVNNSFAVRDAAVAGLGVAQLPDRVAQPAVDSGTLVRVLPQWQPPSVPVSAVFASNRYLSAKVRAFVDLAVRDFATTTDAKPATRA